MPINITSIANGNILCITLSGEIQASDLAPLLHHICIYPDFSPDRHLLIDGRKAQLRFSPKELLPFNEQFASLLTSTTGRTAIVATTPIETAIGMIHERELCKFRRTMLFYTESHAHDWLSNKRVIPRLSKRV